MEKQTVMEMFDATVERDGDAPALATLRDGDWVFTSWSEYRQLVHRAARALIHLGVEPQTGVSIIGFNCAQWMIADVAAIHVGAFPAGIYTTSSAEQCQYIAEHSDSSLVVVEDAEQLAKITAIKDQLPKLKAAVMMKGSDDAPWVYGWDEFLALGDQVEESALQARIDAQGADDACTFIYTSGTTGNPKAVTLTHDNLTWNVRTVAEAARAQPHERVVSYLPLSHIAEQGMSIYLPMLTAGCTYFALSLDTLGEHLKQVRPTIFVAVPRVWEKIQAKMQAVAREGSGLKQRIGKWARGVGMRAATAGERGQSPPALHGIADKIVFSKVRENLGLDQCRLAITSAAPIGRDTLDFFWSLGVPVFEVYGMSETAGAATMQRPDRYRIGTIGWPTPGTELKIAEDGEICMRGRHIMKGYYKNPEATAETIDDEGWLHSGDVGEIDADGFLRITDRKKEILITAGGENVAPAMIEGLLRGIDCISQAVVVGDRQKHLSALLTLDETKLVAATAAAGSPAKTLAEASGCERMHAYLMGEVETVNGHLARVQTIKKIRLLSEDFSIDGGELTPTMKLRRKVILEKHRTHVEAFYA